MWLRVRWAPPLAGRRCCSRAALIFTSQTAGVAHGAYDNELDALAGMRELLAFLPLSNREQAPRVRACGRPEPLVRTGVCC